MSSLFTDRYRQAPPLRRFCATSLTDAAFPAKIITATRPSGNGILALDEPVPMKMLLIPFGTGADNSTADLRLLGWRLVTDATGTPLYLPTLIVQLAVTLSAAVGVASGVLVATERMADTLTVTTTLTDGAMKGTRITSPTGDIIAHAEIDLEGFDFLELTADLGTATAANALYALV